MTDQFILYDQAMLTWVSTYLSPLLVGRTVQVLFVTPRKTFAEVTTGQLVDERTLIVPRISVQRLDPENDPTRYNSNRMRRLGWAYSDLDDHRSMLSSKFPAPVNVQYQIDLWTRFVEEMNLWERYVLEEFASTYIYLRIRPNDVYGWKKYIVFLRGIANNSDLEPGEGEREIRKTVTLECQCWMFPDVITPKPIVKRIEYRVYDYDNHATEYFHGFAPPVELLATGNGTTKDYTGTLTRLPIIEHTPVIQTVIAGTVEIVDDDGLGHLIGRRLTSGTIDYVTGAYALHYASPPDNNEPITTTYFTNRGN